MDENTQALVAAQLTVAYYFCHPGTGDEPNQIVEKFQELSKLVGESDEPEFVGVPPA